MENQTCNLDLVERITKPEQQQQHKTPPHLRAQVSENAPQSQLFLNECNILCNVLFILRISYIYILCFDFSISDPSTPTPLTPPSPLLEHGSMQAHMMLEK